MSLALQDKNAEPQTKNREACLADAIPAAVLPAFLPFRLASGSNCHRRPERERCASWAVQPVNAGVMPGEEAQREPAANQFGLA